jgi:hypothetical protein
MKRLLKIVLAFALISVTGCGGGGNGSGGTSTGGVYLTHEQLAREFVHRLNLDAGYDVDLVKSNTYQYDYVVVYDYDLGTYDAYNIGNFSPGQNIFSWLRSNEYKFYYDLTPIGFNQYQDWYTGIIFEKTAPSPKDRMTLAALEEGLQVKKASDTLVAQFGLSQERSQEVAKLAMVWKKTPKERMTNADHDRFAQEILGHSLTDYKNAIDKKGQGKGSELKELIASTAELNGVSPEQMNGIISGVFGVNIE